jgi:RNA polymerase sigma-70 factor (ECF subfamily)
MGKIETAPLGAMMVERQNSFQTLLESHQKIVFKVAGAYCRHPDERQDLIQEISVQLWKAFPGYDESRKFSTWMYRIALNVAISFARKAAHREGRLVVLDDDSGTSNFELRTVNSEAEFLHRFIAELDELNRALMLLYLEENSYAEIAEILGITETNVATKISRLKQRIREASHKENQ